MLLPPHKSNRQAIPFLVYGLYQDLKVIGCYWTAVQVYNRRGGLLTCGSMALGAAVCFPLSGLVIGVSTRGVLDWGFSQLTFFPPLPLDAVVAPASSVMGWCVSAIPLGTLVAALPST